MKTTLNKIRAKGPCNSGWAKLLRNLGKTEADDEEISIATIIDSNGLRDAIWCLRAVDGHDKEIRLYAVWCARQVQHLMKDERSIRALDVAERYANGMATRDELESARSAAYAAYADSAAAYAADAAYADADAYAADAAAYASSYAYAYAYADAYAADAYAAYYSQEKRLREICQEADNA